MLRLPRNVILQRTIPCTSHPEPRSNATRDFNRLRLPPNVCACHTTSHCNVPFPAPATQSHAPTLPGCFNHLPPNVALVLRLPRNITPQRTCNVFPAPATQTHTPMLPGCFNRLRLLPNVTLVLRHSVTLQHTLPCTSHPEPRSNATRMLQSPATKCHTGAAPATQRHTATYMQRTIPCTSHPEPRSNATRMLQSTAPATKCHTGAAPATQRHNSTYHSLHQPHRSTLQLEVSRAQASQFHVYKRANFTCTSEPAPGQGLVVSYSHQVAVVKRLWSAILIRLLWSAVGGQLLSHHVAMVRGWWSAIVTQKTPPQKTPPQKHHHKNQKKHQEKTPPQKHYHKKHHHKKHHHKNTTTKKHHRKKTPPQKNTTTKKNTQKKPQKQKNTTTKNTTAKTPEARLPANFHTRSLQSDCFVRGFLQISKQKLPKRAFRARRPPNFTEQASKTSVSRDAFGNLDRRSFQNDRFVRGFPQISTSKIKIV